MSSSLLSTVTTLKTSQHKRLIDLEARLACRIVAYQYRAQIAELPPEGYVLMRQLEQRLGVALVAYRPTNDSDQVLEPETRTEQHPESLLQLSPEDAELLSAIEDELDLVLIAHRS
jgi:hypothetical protein